MKKFKTIANNIKEKIGKLKNNIIEKINTNKFVIIMWSQLVLNVVTIILLICSLVTTSNLSKQVNDISKQSTKTTSSTTVTSKPVETTSDVSSETISSSSDISSSATSSTSSSNPTSSNTPTSSTTITPVPSTNKSSDIELLACVIYQEAGGDEYCDTCRRRVADVVLNRVNHPEFPNTIKEVLTAKNQYGRYYYTGVVWPSRAKNVYEKDAVARAYRIAEEVLNGKHSELYGNGYIWQARFRQGTSGFWCCGEYFGK